MRLLFFKRTKWRTDDNEIMEVRMTYKLANAARRLGCVLLAAMLLLSLALAGTGPASAQAAGAGVTVKLHYHRPDGNYDGWDSPVQLGLRSRQLQRA